MKYELVIFDWDGTLMDSVARIVSCMQAAATDCHLPVPTPEAVRHIIGLSLYKAFPVLFGELSPKDSDALLLAYRRHYLEVNTTPSPLFAGAADTLTGLHQTGYRLAVATGKQRVGLDRVLDETGLGHLFHALRGADQARSKPDPLMLAQIAAVHAFKEADAKAFALEGAGAVQGRLFFQVAVNLGGRERAKVHMKGLHQCRGAAGGNIVQAQAGIKGDPFAGGGQQLLPGLFNGAGLAQQFVAVHTDLIRANHQPLPIVAGHRRRLLLCQAQGQGLAGFTGQGGFVYVRAVTVKGQPQAGQQGAAIGRGRGEDQGRHGCTPQ